MPTVFHECVSQAPTFDGFSQCFSNFNVQRNALEPFGNTDSDWAGPGRGLGGRICTELPEDAQTAGTWTTT